MNHLPLQPDLNGDCAGGRIGIIVRAIDMPFWVNPPLDPVLKAKVDAPCRAAPPSARFPHLATIRMRYGSRPVPALGVRRPQIRLRLEKTRAAAI